MDVELVQRIDVGATLGEGVIWDHRLGEAFWTDIQGRTFYRYELSSKTLRHIDLEERLTAFGLSEDRQWLIAAFETGFAWFSAQSGEVCWIERLEEGATGRRFNDGRVGPDGRFWCGTMVEDASLAGGEEGRLYCLDGEGRSVVAFSGVSISNSLCWSPDGATMYFADSPKRKIWAFEYDMKNGVAGAKRIFAETPEGVYPDGAVVDAEGCLWSAQWGGARVARYSPDGDLLVTVDVPISQPSCVAFGGDNLDLLFVTSAREGLSVERLDSEPFAGDVFVYKTESTGLPSALFCGAPPSGGGD